MYEDVYIYKWFNKGPLEQGNNIHIIQRTKNRLKKITKLCIVIYI